MTTETNECRVAFKKHANKIGLDAREREDGTFMTNHAEAAFGYFSAGAAWNRPAAPAEVGTLTDDDAFKLWVETQLTSPYPVDTKEFKGMYARAIERALNQRLAVKKGASCTSQEPHICRHHPDGNIAYQLAAELDELEDDQQAKDAARWNEVIKGKPLVIECLNKNGKPVIVYIGDRAECANWREAYTEVIDAALSATKQEEV